MSAQAPRRTKIVATIGPASSSHDVVRDLVRAGMDAARLNMSHGGHDDHRARAELVRRVQEEEDRPLALIADLQGPKLRVGELPEPIELGSGGAVTVVGEARARRGGP